MSKSSMEKKVSATPDVEVALTPTHTTAHDAKVAVPVDADKAANFLLNTEGYDELSPEAEKRLKRKIDWVMVPMVGFCYTLLKSSLI